MAHEAPKIGFRQSAAWALRFSCAADAALSEAHTLKRVQLTNPLLSVAVVGCACQPLAATFRACKRGVCSRAAQSRPSHFLCSCVWPPCDVASVLILTRRVHFRYRRRHRFTLSPARQTLPNAETSDIVRVSEERETAADCLKDSHLLPHPSNKWYEAALIL